MYYFQVEVIYMIFHSVIDVYFSFFSDTNKENLCIVLSHPFPIPQWGSVLGPCCQGTVELILAKISHRPSLDRKDRTHLAWHQDVIHITNLNDPLICNKLYNEMEILMTIKT